MPKCCDKHKNQCEHEIQRNMINEAKEGGRPVM